ncbi:MAG TPA: tyrosine-type recombinase/integrase [Thermoguttaceae bacterium]|nr:tyrosine-type recombinase/integrase [Thermoguttaceae bacterium]
MKAWTFQDHRQKQKLGEKKCLWSVGWIDPDGRKRSKIIGCKSAAERYARKIEGQLAAGLYQDDSRKTWAGFRNEYEQKIVAGMEPGTRRETLLCMEHFERIVSPNRLQAIKTATIDDYISKRRGERGRKQGSIVSPATVNKELRHLKTVLRVANEWGYLPVVPRFRMLKEPQKLPTYVTPEHFAAIYEACGTAIRPADQPYSPADWWRTLLVFAYMTGWRVGEPLALRWDDVSLDNGTAITRHGDNKGKRDDVASLHPVVVEHLRKLADGSITCPLVFYWPHHERTLWLDFHEIQRAAGIDLPCHENHVHTPACHVYGFHDLRRASSPP